MSTRFEEIPVTKLVFHPQNPRAAIGDVSELAASIQAQGVLQPLLVGPHPKQRTKFIVLAGHRRMAGAQKAKLKTVPCTVREDLDTLPVQLEAMLVENLQRTDLNVVEEATAYQTLLDLPGYDAKRIAASTGRSQRLVKSRLKLVGLPDQAKESVAAGQLTLEQAEALLEFNDDEEATTELLQAAGGNNWDFTLSRARRAREAAEHEAEVKKALEGTGAQQLPPDGRYNGKWSYIFAGTDELSVAEHVAQGHHYDIDRYDASLDWYKPVERPGRPEPSDEDKAERKQLEEWKAALQVAAEVRDKHLKRKVLSPPLQAPHKALVNMIRARTHQMPRVAELIGLSPDVDPAIVAEQVPAMSLEQLALILHILDRGLWAEAELIRPPGWDVRGWTYLTRTSDWIGNLTDIYQYEFSDIETKIRDHYQALADKAEGGGDGDEE